MAPPALLRSKLPRKTVLGMYHPSERLVRRDLGLRAITTTSSSSNNTVYIIGFVVAGLVALGAVLWLVIRWYRRKKKAEREGKLGGAFLTVRGIVSENSPKASLEKSHRKTGASEPIPFAPVLSSTAVTFPDKAVTRSSRPARPSREGSSELYPESTGVARPFSFALSASQLASAGSRHSPSLSFNRPTSSRAYSRNSTFSIRSSRSHSSDRISFLSTTSSIYSQQGAPTRPVRQVFEPVLPDELTITRIGERLTILQNFDDGWCVVGRDTHRKSILGLGAFKAKNSDTTGVELGVVPAWVFIKPMKGLRAERPVRSSSLQATADMQQPSAESREVVMSWSNFA